MITSFKNYELITEDPDYVWDEEIEHGYSCEWNESRPFTVDPNKNHTEVENVHFGRPGTSHGEMENLGKKTYPGRIWLKSKILAFWVYPNDQLFKSFINKVEKKLGIKIFNNGWKVEVQKIGDKIKKKKVTALGGFYLNDGGYMNAILIPVEKYISSEDVPDEQRKMHLMGWKEKQLAKRAGLLNMKGWGSDQTAWDQPKNLAYRQTVHQENKKQ